MIAFERIKELAKNKKISLVEVNDKKATLGINFSRVAFFVYISTISVITVGTVVGFFCFILQ